MTVMDFPTAPIDGQTSTDGRYYFDASVGDSGAWRSAPLPVGGLPAGSIIQWSSNTAPANWLVCNGAAVSRVTYSSLFAVIGTTYGTGNGSTTFNLPDLRGRVAVGRDGAQSEFDVLGETGGAKTHTLTIAEIPSHTHSYGSNTSIAATGVNHGTAFNNGSYTSGATGGGGAHNNLQPFLVTNYIIKASSGWTAGDSELATRLGAVEARPPSGLVPISPSSVVVAGAGSSASANSLGKITFSNATSLSLNGVFTSGYSNYRFVFSATHSSGPVQISARLRSSGVDNSGTYVFGGTYQRITGGSPTGFANASASAFPIIIVNPSASGPQTTTGDIFFPAESKSTTIVMGGYWADSAGALGMNVSALHAPATPFDGLSIISGTLTGTMQIFGYNE
jgi:microcystin-dependent protein